MARPRIDDPIFDEPLLERSSVEIPPNYLSNAPGVLFPGRKMLHFAGCVSGKSCPFGWEKVRPGVSVKFLRDHTLRVRQSGNWRSRWWAVERVDRMTREVEALVFAFQEVPVWGHTRRQAMFLAEFYQAAAALQLVGCCWKKPY